MRKEVTDRKEYSIYTELLDAMERELSKIKLELIKSQKGKLK